MDCIFTQIAQKEYGADYFPWYFERVHGGIMITASKCPLITRGKNKGQPNFKKRDKTTDVKIFIPRESKK